jgi:hypothetical protein
MFIKIVLIRFEYSPLCLYGRLVSPGVISICIIRVGCAATVAVIYIEVGSLAIVV